MSDPPGYGCDCGKRRYRTRREARHAARHAQNVKLRVYRCGRGYWHLTSADADETVYHRTRRADAVG